ncbi:hypothetical protein A176_000737 [Myxococcus hansupus]|uniref:CHRD domain-containing protein n=1 Tax=Pseudomyxococcus hansupus TaxID=1297742 RepID=A0A0H4WR35_9BACT|nr:hypothetical protein [Myxococcus hansupus]AKQ63825.1 hypothetical protein A176_000737 [Myxococcus hansupus]
MQQSKLFGLLFVLPMLMLSTSAHAFNINGTYTSENGDFVLTITQSNDFNGSFSGTYVAQFTPVGPLTMPVSGSFHFVNNPNGNLVPLALEFSAATRPADRSYLLADAWSGILTQPGVIAATGVRSYLPAGGTGVLSSLGTHTLK